MFQPGYLGKLLPDSAPNYPEPLQHVLNGLITLLYISQLTFAYCFFFICHTLVLVIPVINSLYLIENRG
jgi:hypothetical protein